METDSRSSAIIRIGLQVAERVVAVAAEGGRAVTGQLQEIHNRLLAAANDHSDAGKNLNDIRKTIGNMSEVIATAQFNGVNLLSDKGAGGADGESYKVLASLDRSYGDALTKVSLIEVDSANLEISPLVELKNLFLYNGDHNPTTTPPVEGTPLDENKIAIITGVNLTQTEFADVLAAAKNERAAFRAIENNNWPSEAEKERYRLAFNAYYDAIMKDDGLTDDQKTELQQKKAHADERILIARGTSNRVFKRLADEAVADFFAAAANAGIKSPTILPQPKSVTAAPASRVKSKYTEQLTRQIQRRLNLTVMLPANWSL